MAKKEVIVDCRVCKKEIANNAKVCPHCGAKAPGVSAASQKKRAIGCGLTVLIIAAIFFIGNFADDKNPTDKDHSIMATIQCNNFVKDRLLSPSTADFPFSQPVVRTGKQIYLVSSYADSQNAFGATIRTKFVCRVEYVGGDEASSQNWKLLSLNFLQ